MKPIYHTIQDILTAHSQQQGECLLWNGERDKDGYGRYTIKSNRFSIRIGRWVASRLVYTNAYGTIPKGLKVLHHCDNPPCINVSHLFLGTQSDNIKDAVIKQRYVSGFGKGEKHYAAKLNDTDIIDIFDMYNKGYTPLEIAIEFKITRTYVYQILNKKVRND